MATSAPTLNCRALNRATLARQHLLVRTPMRPETLLEHLLGLQAQEVASWYVGFWSRIERFDPREVSRLIKSHRAVRIALMRSTIHLVTTEDALTLRPLMQPAVERPMTGPSRRLLKELHAEKIAAEGRTLLSAHPLTNVELGRQLEKRWPEVPGRDLAMAVRVFVPLVQVPPRGLWRENGAARHMPLETWVGRDLGPALPAEELVLRYLAAFGPATPADAQAWSGLTRLREVFERLRPKLVTFGDERGRELFDLPDAPRPDPETPAPVRFIYDYDNLLLGYADRTRFLAADLGRRLIDEIGMYSYGTVLVDGFVAGIWRIERDGRTKTLIVKPVSAIAKLQHAEVETEGERLAAFLGDGAKEIPVVITDPI